ncbi:MAG TPA: polysaccharide biosynthesis tyrosine autokinase [Tepidisphaeraceae bacterium]
MPSTSSIRLPRIAGPGGQGLGPPGGPIGPVMTAPVAANMSPADVWRVIRGNLWLIILSVVLSAAAGFAWYKYEQKYNPLYRAVGAIVLDRPVVFDPMNSDRGSGFDYNLTVEAKTHAKTLMDPSLWMDVLTNNQVLRDTTWFKNFERQAASSREQTTTAAMLARDSLEDSFRATPEPDSKLLRVSMEAPSGKDAKDIVYLIVEAHIANQKERSRSKADSELQMSLQWSTRYKDAMSRAKVRMSALEQRLSDTGSPQAISRLNVQEMEISRLIDAQMKAKLESAEAEGQYGAMQSQINEGKDPPQVDMMVRQDPTVNRLKDTVDQLDLAREGAKAQGEKSRYYIDLNQRFEMASAKLRNSEDSARATVRAQLIGTLQSTIQARKSEVESLTQQIEARQRSLGQAAADIAEFQNAKDEFESYRVLERELNEKIEVLRLARNNDTAGVRWNGMPITPDTMSSPKLPICLSVATVLGLGLSLGYAFLREITDTRVRSPRDIAKVGPMNLLGMIADESDDPQLAGVPLHMVIGQAPHSIMAEQIRQVRTRLQHAASLDTTRTIVVTSPSPQDGKSVIACNLAAGLALNGRRILLVDANFRRPELHKLFGVGNETGFSNVLDSVSHLESAVQRTSVPNLELLTTGPKPTNPTELIESQLFSDFIDRALEEYDHVIFDTGPLLVVSEAVALAPRADGVITVVRAKKNTRGMLSRVSGIYRQIKAEHLGVVLNGVQTWGGGYYRRNIKTYYAYQNAE